MFKHFEGYLVPACDRDPGRRRAHWTVAQKVLYNLFPNKGGTCVQAGGSWGFWPNRLSFMFDFVYTFEPDPVQFSCLAVNNKVRTNVFKYQAALGQAHKMVALCLEKSDNSGSTRVIDTRGPIPTLKIDDLGLHACDLIYLDIEGSEKEAIFGATATIAEYRPIVAFESSKKYDPENEVQNQLMGWHKYKKVAQIGRDVVMAPEDICSKSLLSSGSTQEE